jgi:hypothetical protein
MFTAVPKEVATDHWIKVVGMLQQNWAVIVDQSDSALVVFYNGLCAVFDEMQFDSVADASFAVSLAFQLTVPARRAWASFDTETLDKIGWRLQHTAAVLGVVLVAVGVFLI